ERCADITCTSNSMSSVRSRSAAPSIVSQSLSLPITMPTSGRPSRAAMCLPRRERTMPDVAPVVHAGPTDALDRAVRLRDRPLDRVAEGRHAEDASTVGDERPVDAPRPGMEDDPVAPAPERLDTRNRPPALDRTGIALGREHDAGGGARVPFDRRSGEPPRARPLDQV